MEAQHPPDTHQSSSAAVSGSQFPLRQYGTIQSPAMDVDMASVDNDRAQRAASVLSGMSAEDMEAAETLNSLHAKFHASPQTQPPPTHLQSTSTYDADTQPEPILSLLTSTHPLAATLINSSLYTYKTAQAFIPGAYSVEQYVGLPLARTAGRVTGVEAATRWALQRKPSTDKGIGQQHRGPAPPGQSSGGLDVEKGLYKQQVNRQSSQLSFAEPLPAYDETGRSPPYSEQQLVQQTPPGWRQQLIVTTSGLGVAMSEESLRSLRYCLSWLTWANQRLAGAVQNLKELLYQWDQGKEKHGTLLGGSQSQDSQQATISSRIAALRTDVLATLKQVVEVVSNYAGGALPENARNLVHMLLTSLPQRFSAASASAANDNRGNEAAEGAKKVMVLAQEGLDMMSQVSRVVNDTLVSAEGWCERLGRRTGQEQPQGPSQPMLSNVKTEESRERSTTVGRESDQDVKMDM